MSSWDRMCEFEDPAEAIADYIHQGDGPDLVEFLRARLDEAQAAAESLNRWPTKGSLRITYEDEGGHWDHGEYDPARVLADVEAKRAIVQTYADFLTLPEDERVIQRVTLEWVCELLATEFADHPEYRAEWKPYD